MGEADPGEDVRGSGPPITFTVVDSTQTVAFDLAAAGADDGTVVVADYQREGRGRRGRQWRAEPRASLLTSILVRSRLAMSDLPLYSFAAALAVADAVTAVGGCATRLKWPNDVLVDGRKVAGILLESRTQPPAPPVVAVGIGVNLRQTAFPDDLAARATSVRLATGRDVNRDDALQALLGAFRRWRAELEQHGFAPLRDRWLANSDTIGRVVDIDGVRGVAVDLAGDGALVIAKGCVRRRVVAGEIGWQSSAVAAPVESDAPRR
ncbi:MAG: biotin--[acetyl-CoA-carboxylase] ligase [Candidatus Rokubacteria bacterium]|nr:biotin--[acetyl-CoA-carboxylase] ligase [Candidatus Rokubacteria bacterium]